MSDGTSSIANVGDLAKPATTLIEKVSDFVEGALRPIQTRRVARAEADASKIKAEGEAAAHRALATASLESRMLERRAFARFRREEARKQANMEKITAMALPHVLESATPDAIDPDWLVDFYEKCRNTSNEAVQELWARVLAGEANEPGQFSRRTLSLLPTLGRADAEALTVLSGLVISVNGSLDLLAAAQSKLDKGESILHQRNIRRLENSGLLMIMPTHGRFVHTVKGDTLTIGYFGKSVTLERRDANQKTIAMGWFTLSSVGWELLKLIDAKPDEKVWEHIVSGKVWGGFEVVSKT